MTQTPDEIAVKLSDAERRFLTDVCEGRKLGCADRAEDKIRQKLRRIGLVFVAKCPRRWEPTSLGLAVRTALQKDTQP